MIELESHAINYVLTHYRGLLRLRRDDLEVLINWSLQHNKDVLHHSLEDIVVQHCNSIYELNVIIRRSRYIELISQVLSSSKTLKVLHIQYLSDSHSRVIKCLAISKNNFLHDLKMGGCGLNPTAIDTIGEMLSDNKSIRSVDLSYNCITDDGVKKLVHHLMNNNTLHQINLSSNNITEIGANHLRRLITRDHSSLASIELSKNPLKDEGVDLLLQSLPIGTEHIGLCDVQMTQVSCQSLGDALHKVKSISFDQLFDFTVTSATFNQEMDVADKYLKVINNYIKLTFSDYSKVITTSLLSTTVLEHLEISLTRINSTTHKLINVIRQNDSIKTLKLYCDSIPCVGISDEESCEAELVPYLQHSKVLTKLIISGVMESLPLFFTYLLTDSLTTNTSVKSMIYDLSGFEGYGMSSENVCEFINKLKENNTLEDLTLNKVMHVGNDLEVENCVQQVNKARDIKGIANLKLNITYIIYSYIEDF